MSQPDCAHEWSEYEYPTKWPTCIHCGVRWPADDPERINGPLSLAELLGGLPVPDYDNCEACGMMLTYPEEREVGFCLGCQWKEDEEGDD